MPAKIKNKTPESLFLNQIQSGLEFTVEGLIKILMEIESSFGFRSQYHIRIRVQRAMQGIHKELLGEASRVSFLREVHPKAKLKTTKSYHKHRPFRYWTEADVEMPALINALEYELSEECQMLNEALGKPSLKESDTVAIKASKGYLSFTAELTRK